MHFLVGYGLKCYRCVSTKSWDDCASVKKEVNCSADENRCSKAFASGKKDGASVDGYFEIVLYFVYFQKKSSFVSRLV